MSNSSYNTIDALLMDTLMDNEAITKELKNFHKEKGKSVGLKKGPRAMNIVIPKKLD